MSLSMAVTGAEDTGVVGLCLAAALDPDRGLGLLAASELHADFNVISHNRPCRKRQVLVCATDELTGP